MRALILQLTAFRFFTIYIVQSFLIVFYLGISFKLLRKKKDISSKRLIFSIYYLSCSIGLIINDIYALIQHEIITSFLYLMTIYIIYSGTSFIAVFAITMYQEINDKTNNSNVQIAYAIVLNILYIVIFFIPESVITNAETRWYPKVSLFFFLYCTIFIDLSLLIFIIYSIKTLKIFKMRKENKILLNRWKIYIIGIIETFLFAILAMFVHFLDNKLIRDIWAIFGSILFITGIYLTWFGIGKKFL